MASSASSAPSGGVGMNVAAPPPPKTHFVGLDNQGATCYLNALIQAMYMTPELRHGLYALDPRDLGLQQRDKQLKKEMKRANERRMEEQKQDRGEDQAIVNSLMTMGFSRDTAITAALQTSNKGIEPALEWCLTNAGEMESNAEQPPPSHDVTATLAAEDELRDGVEQLEGASPATQEKDKSKKPKGGKPTLIPLELQWLFARLQLLDARAISTEELTTRGFQWESADGRVQHDIHELNRLLIDVLERSLARSRGKNLVPALYKGLVVNKVKCLDCGHVSERDESFYDVVLQVKGSRNLTSALLQYTRPEELRGQDRYFCDKCRGKRDAVRCQMIRHLPPILSFSLNRFEFDMSTYERVKVTDRFEYPLAIDLEPFLEDRPWQGVPAGTSPLELAQLADVKQITIGEEDDRELSGKMVYDLFAVLIHRGTAYSGHYHVFVKDCLDTGDWVPPEGSSPLAPVDEGAPLPPVDNGTQGSKDPSGVALAEGSQEWELAQKPAGKRKKSKSARKRNRRGDKAATGDRGEGGGVLEQETSAGEEDAGKAVCDPGEEPSIIGGAEGEGLGQSAAVSGKGHWFNFDDSTITPITTEDLLKPFEGTNAAYLLVYRARSLSNPSAVSLVRPSGIEFAELPPEHWVHLAAEENARLSLAREQAADRKVKLLLHFPNQLQWDPPHLTPAQAGQLHSLPIKFKDPVVFEAPFDCKLAELKGSILRKLGGHALDLGVPPDVDLVDLAILSRHGPGMFISGSVNASVPIARQGWCQAGCVPELLMWACEVGGVSLASKWLGNPPVELSVSLLAPGSSTLTPQVVDTATIYVHANASVEDICISLMEKFGLDSHRLVVSALREEIIGKGRNRRTRMFAVPLVGIGGSASNEIPFMDGQRILVEDCEARGLRAESLADAEAARLNRIINVSVSLTPSVSVLLGLGDGEFDIPRLDMEVDASELTAGELKLQCLQQLTQNGVEACKKIGDNLGIKQDRDFFHESQSLEECGVEHGVELLIHVNSGREVAADPLRPLKYAIVRGNDPDPTHNSAMPGTRDALVSLEAGDLKSLPEGLTVVQMKDFLISQAYRRGFIQPEEIDAVQWRLRLTRHMEEAGAIVSEVQKSGKASYKPIPWKDSDAVGCDLLLLEQGIAPRPGEIRLQLYIWGPDEDREAQGLHVTDSGASMDLRRAHLYGDALDIMHAQRMMLLRPLEGMSVAADATPADLLKKVATTLQTHRGWPVDGKKKKRKKKKAKDRVTSIVSKGGEAASDGEKSTESANVSQAADALVRIRSSQASVDDAGAEDVQAADEVEVVRPCPAQRSRKGEHAKDLQARLRLRELRSDRLPGRFIPRKPVNTTAPELTKEQSSILGYKTKLAPGEKTLTELGLRASKPIVVCVEAISSGDDAGPIQGPQVLHLWAFHRHRPVEASAWDEPKWPGPLHPVEIRKGSRASLEQLQKALGDAFNIPHREVAAFKHDTRHHKWVRLESSKRKGRTQGSLHSLNLKDGDCVGVIDRREDRDGKADLSRPEDVAALAREADSAEAGKAKGKTSKQSPKVSLRAEAQLRLGFSDDFDYDSDSYSSG